jgi:hypothetical protein
MPTNPPFKNPFENLFASEHEENNRANRLMPSSMPTTNPIVTWLSEQWFFLTALVLGAGHAATQQAKIAEQGKKLEALETVSDRLARIETHLEHLLEKVTSRH